MKVTEKHRFELVVETPARPGSVSAPTQDKLSKHVERPSGRPSQTIPIQIKQGSRHGPPVPGCGVSVVLLGAGVAIWFAGMRCMFASNQATLEALGTALVPIGFLLGAFGGVIGMRNAADVLDPDAPSEPISVPLVDQELERMLAARRITVRPVANNDAVEKPSAVRE